MTHITGKQCDTILHLKLSVLAKSSKELSKRNIPLFHQGCRDSYLDGSICQTNKPKPNLCQKKIYTRKTRICTLFMSSDRTVSNTPKGMAIDTGSLIQLGNLSFKNLMLQDLAPTYMGQTPF